MIFTTFLGKKKNVVSSNRIKIPFKITLMHRTVVQIVVYFVMTVTSNIFLGIFSNDISQLPANEIIPQWRRFRVRVISAHLQCILCLPSFC